MILRFSWNLGRSREVVDVELLLADMPMTNYRKWIKLFARYGTTEQHMQFMQVANEQIQSIEEQAKQLELEVLEFQLKAERKVRTFLAPKYCQEQAALKQKHLNGVQKRLKRYQTMTQLAEGCFGEWAI